MEPRYHDFRRQVLLARQAYLEECEPEQLAASLVAAARELLLLMGRISPEMLWQAGRQPLLERLGRPDVSEPVRLLAQAHLLAEQARWLEATEECRRWWQQAYRLLWHLDCLLIELASDCRDAAPHRLIGSASATGAVLH